MKFFLETREGVMFLTMVLLLSIVIINDWARHIWRRK